MRTAWPLAAPGRRGSRWFRAVASRRPVAIVLGVLLLSVVVVSTAVRANPGIRYVYLSRGEYVPVPPRYSLLPAAADVVAASLRAVPVLVVAGGAAVVYVVSAMTWSTAVPV